MAPRRRRARRPGISRSWASFAIIPAWLTMPAGQPLMMQIVSEDGTIPRYRIVTHDATTGVDVDGDESRINLIPPDSHSITTAL